MAKKTSSKVQIVELPKESVTSPSGSLKGWNPLTMIKKNRLFIIKNKDSIKATISTLCGLIASSYPDSIWIKILFGAGSMGLSYWISCIIDYKYSDVKLE